MKKHEKPSLASVWGVIPETFKFPLDIYPGSEIEKSLLAKSSIHRIVWNFFVQEANYRLDLRERVKAGTALFEEQTVLDKQTGKIGWDTRISTVSFNYLLQTYRNCPASANTLQQVTVWSLQETAGLVCGGFSSWMKLRKNKDTDARPPFYKDEETFQTMIWKGVFLKKDTLILDGIKIPIPASTRYKIGARKMAHVIIDRHESKLYLDSTWSVQCVLMDSPAPMPVPTKRVTALCFGTSGVAGVDSRGQAFFIKMRRPDLYRYRKNDGSRGETLRDLIAKVDVPLTLMRENIKTFPKNERAKKWRELELDPKYQALKKKRAELYDALHRKQRDYHRKLADKLVQMGDCFFVGKPSVRSKDNALADTSDGKKDKNWNVQNTGSLSECIRLFEWACKKHGKIFIAVKGEVKVNEVDYRTRKVKQAREIFFRGLDLTLEEKKEVLTFISFAKENEDCAAYTFSLTEESKVNVFLSELYKHKVHFLTGYKKLFDQEEEIPAEVSDAHKWFNTTTMWNTAHIEKVKVILRRCSFQKIPVIHISAGKTRK